MNPNGPFARIVTAMALGVIQVVYSDAILAELDDVLRRPRIASRFGGRDQVRLGFLDQLRQRGVHVVPHTIVTLCRDPKNNMFLEVALAGRADVIISGDEDLLSLGAFEGIPIITAGRFLALIEAQGTSI